MFFLLAAGVKSTVVTGENLTVGSTIWLPDGPSGEES
jgi:hypothetical protein